MSTDLVPGRILKRDTVQTLWDMLKSNKRRSLNVERIIESHEGLRAKLATAMEALKQVAEERPTDGACWGDHYPETDCLQAKNYVICAWCAARKALAEIGKHCS